MSDERDAVIVVTLVPAEGANQVLLHNQLGRLVADGLAAGEIASGEIATTDRRRAPELGRREFGTAQKHALALEILAEQRSRALTRCEEERQSALCELVEREAEVQNLSEENVRLGRENAKLRAHLEDLGQIDEEEPVARDYFKQRTGVDILDDARYSGGHYRLTPDDLTSLADRLYEKVEHLIQVKVAEVNRTAEEVTRVAEHNARRIGNGGQR